MAAPSRHAISLAIPLVLAALALNINISAAHADDGFVLMDRTAPSEGSRELGIDASLSRFSDQLLEPFTVVRLDAHATFFSAAGRAAGIVVLPLALAFQGGENQFASGNLEVGAVLLRSPRPGLVIQLRGSLTLPTASGSRAAAASNGAAGLGRISDLILAMPATFSARASASLLATRRDITARADFGVDVPLSEQGSAIDELERTPVARANLALSMALDSSGSSTHALSLESINVVGAKNVLGATGLPQERTVLHQLGVSLSQRSRAKTMQLGLFTNPASLFGNDDGYIVTLALSLTSQAAP